MDRYFVFTALLLLVIFLWLCVVFWLSGDAAGLVGIVAALLTGAVFVYGWEHSK